MVDYTYIGVDVAKDWLDIWDADSRHERISSQPKELQKFAQKADGAVVVFEASGGYERPLIKALATHQTQFCRVNPRHAREFARATGRLAKTDRVDAQVLAQMGRALALSPQDPPCPKRQRLHDLVARLQDLKSMRRAEMNRHHQANDPFVTQDIRSMLRVIDARIDKLEKEVEASIKACDHLSILYKRVQTMPGVGPTIAAQLLADLPELGQLCRRQIAALAGLAPHATDSGHYRGKRRIWGGRKTIKQALYLAGFIASRYDPRLKAFRTRLKDAGKSTKAAIIATARKLLTILNQMIKKEEDYKAEMA